MDEMDIEPIYLGDELGQRIQPRLDLPPVVALLPVVDERLHRRQLHALGRIGDSLLLGPPRRRQTPAEVDDRLFGSIEAERPDGVARRGAHARGNQAGSAGGGREGEEIASGGRRRWCGHDRSPVRKLTTPAWAKPAPSFLYGSHQFGTV